MEKLWRLGSAPDLAGFHASAMATFWGGLLDGLDRDEAEDLRRLEHAEAGFTAWVLFDLSTPPGATVAERLLAGEGEPLTAAQREWLEAMVASHVALYEVEAVRAGEGLTLRDLWTDRVLKVQERAASHQLVRWDLIAARAVPAAAGRPAVLEGGIYEHVVLAVPRRLVTPEGDDIHVSRAVFEVVDSARTRAALAAHPALKDLGGGDYRWGETVPPGERVLGTLRLAAGRLTIQTLSMARAVEARRLVEDAVGAAVRYRTTTVTDRPAYDFGPIWRELDLVLSTPDGPRRG